ncbi:hypothetical protein OUZ56_002078 [Daphnia magna]|uniref:Uncharacterized protein n=1 Tax=Daphnia magna TaxID=35525 RepID=A0ABR0A4M7_9CRUS|nr:hypothetical protein OUZ56_002078 [Daphnia magna]
MTSIWGGAAYRSSFKHFNASPFNVLPEEWQSSVFEILMENVLLFLLDHLKCCHELHLDFQYVDSPQALLSPRSRHKLKTGLCFRGNIETLAIGQF